MVWCTLWSRWLRDVTPKVWLPTSTDVDEFMAKDDAEDGLADDVTGIRTGKVVEAPQPPAKPRQTRTATMVKATALAAAEDAPPTRPADEHVLDAEFEDVSREEEMLGHGDESPM